MTTNQISVTCTGADCEQSVHVKTVGLVHLGNHVYADPPMVCGACGSPMAKV